MSTGDIAWHYLWADSIANGALGPQGAVGPYGSSGAIGSSAQYGTPAGANGPPGPVMHIDPDPPLISVQNNNRTIMRITAEGNVEWFGKPSEAADGLKTLLENLIDERVKPSTRQRMYNNACRSILEKAKAMDKDELIEYLERSIENRESKAVMMSLRELDEDSQPKDG